MKDTSKNNINYSLLSLVQISLSILVVILHAKRIFSNDVLHFIQKSIFSRMAVPFFIVSSSYFLEHKISRNEIDLQRYIKKMLKVYIFLTILYIPYSLFYFFSHNYPLIYLPLGILFSIFYFGTSYHLWYFPAIILGLLFVETVKRRTSIKQTLLICLLLYTVGAVETYSGYLSDTPIFYFFIVYKKIFVTTRNGIFYTPIFILLGQLAFRYKESKVLSKFTLEKFICSFLILVIEGIVVFLNQGFDKNFLFALIPFTLFFFNWVIKSELFINKEWNKLKQLSVYYFYFHPIFIEIGFIIFRDMDIKDSTMGRLVTFFTFLFIHPLAIYIINKTKYI